MRNRRSFYFWPRIDVWRTCRANSEENTWTLLEQLPEVEGSMPPHSPQGILYTACNVPYLDLFVRDLIRSAAIRSPKQHFHFHFFDPTPEAMASLQEQIEGKRLAVLWEHVDKSKIPIQMPGRVYYQDCRVIRRFPPQPGAGIYVLLSFYTRSYLPY